jgi:hypothetical protein
MPLVVRSSIMRPKSPIALGVPADEPNDTPIRPLVSRGCSSRPASASAISLARVAISATRPMLRVALRW